MTKQVRLTALAVASAAAVSVLAPTAAYAGKEGRRNAAIALGAVAAYGVVKKKPVIAGVAGAGAVYSYVRSQKSDSKRRPRRKVVRHVHHRSCGCAHRPVRHVHHAPPGWSKGKKTGWHKHGRGHDHDD
jgi:hypothetical protein